MKAKSLTETFGGVKTNYKFMSKDEPLTVFDQMLIRRANKSNSQSGTDGYGYSSIHLELCTDSNMHIFNIATLQFYDKNDSLICEHTTALDQTKQSVIFSKEPGEKKRYYSFDLVDIPFFIFDVLFIMFLSVVDIIS